MLLSRIYTKSFGLAGVLLALVMLPSTASASPVIHQQNLGPIQGNVGYLSNLSRGQSFTVGIEGLLASFEFNFNKSNRLATGNATLSLYTTSGIGAPDTLLGTALLPAASVGTDHSFVYFDLTPLGVGVNVGEQYFAALSADFSGGIYSTADTYAGGSDWACGPTFGFPCWTEEVGSVPDLVFRSYVIPVPETGAWALFVLGAAGIGMSRARRNR